MKNQILFLLFILLGCTKSPNVEIIVESPPEQSVPVSEIREVDIGSQIWMMKNLDVEVFRNGDPIPETKSNEEWDKARREGKPAWCCYNNDPAYCEKYGKLYNWYAVNDPRGLAPEGWTVPNNEDWKILIQFVENEFTALKNTDLQVNLGSISSILESEVESTLKSNTDHWSIGKGSNESKFSALPGGLRNFEGIFNHAGSGSYFWSSSEARDNYFGMTWTRSYDYDLAGGKYSCGDDAPIKTFYDCYLGGGLSVRCIKINNPN
jgi:uncharacterized protein (TIGR02145 family)